MRRELTRILFALTFPALLFGGQWLLDIHLPPHLSVVDGIVLGAWLLAVFAAGTVVHELGHVIAVRLAGGQVTRVQLGGTRIHWTVRGVDVSAGLGLSGRTFFRGGLSAGRRVTVYVAGPAASVLFAPLCLLLPVLPGEAAYLALCALATGLQDLVPASTPNGGSTDGARLWQTRARMRSVAEVRALLQTPDWQDRPEAVGVLINGWRLDVPEADDCLQELSDQPASLLRVYLAPWALPEEPSADLTHMVHSLTWDLLTASDLPATAVDLAASRAEWVIAHLDEDEPDERTPRCQVQHTLAVARLRQGRPREARQLCAGALAAKLSPSGRASVLATMAMARHAGLLSGRPHLDEALALDPDAPLVSEAARFLDGGWDTALARPPA